MTAPPDGDVVDHLVARLRHKRCLVVVDNCEHVLAAAADAVERIVAACPNVVVLATSREPLMVRGERLVPVPSLTGEEAERLFLERARDEGVSQRESGEMAARLHDAAKLGGVTGDLLDELDRDDVRGRITETTRQSCERGWRTIRARPPIPTNRFFVPPYIDFNDGGLDAADVDEFLASLDHWITAPTVTRFYAEWFVIRALSHNGHFEHAERQLSQFTPFVNDLDSRQALRLVADLHGTIAMERQDWQDAAHWYSKVTEETEGGLTTWFDLTAAWHLLAARCLCPEPADITGAELRDPWHCFQNEGHDVLQWHGATSTALALHRLGHADLADRFVSWVYANDTIEAMDAFTRRLAAAGLPTTAIDHESDLETLIAEVYTVADQLDGIEP